MVKDVNPGSASAKSAPTSIAVFPTHMLMILDDGVHGNELWITDGSSTGTYMVDDTNPGIRSSDPYYVRSTSSNKLFFVGDDGVHGKEWLGSIGNLKN
ncbi:MAG: hypothetical protein J0M15_11225 [Deltaproteobacteria bacterium]|nr:hypothetical protein [Deltaproteobacteria bacterium]